MSNTLDLLLKMELPHPPEKVVKLKRLSQICGAPVELKLRALSYSKAAELTSSVMDDLNVHIILAGVVEPNLKDRELLEKYGAATPAELVKKLLLAGEIESLAREIERLSGYRTNTIEEVKKN